MRDWIFSGSAAEERSAGLRDANAQIRELQAAIEHVIRGKSETVKLALIALLAKGHLLIEDVPGIGKTTLANALSRALDLSFQRIQFTSDLMPSDVLGLSIFNQSSGDFDWKPGPVFSNIVLADEINRATPKTQSALLEAMAEEQVTVEGFTRPLPSPFIVIATQNPAEHHGTYPLPESQLDRFMLRLHIGYPSIADERQLLRDRESADPLERVRPVMSRDDLIDLQDRVGRVRVDDALVDYLLQIVEKTRTAETLDLGISPRGTLALFRSAQALAVVEGRDYCIADDIKRLVVPCFGHRIMLNAKLGVVRSRTREAANVLNEILQTVAVPI